MQKPYIIKCQFSSKSNQSKKGLFINITINMERPFFVIWWTSDDVGDFNLDQHVVIKCSKSNKFKKGWFLNISLNMKRHFLWFDEHLVTLMMLIWINMWLQRYIITHMVFYKPIYICHIFVYNVCAIKCFSYIQL